ncbi:MAG TPA: polysaccharide pyruvyl transferase family protein [Clostridiales bacterium]|nr:polysaccharide pyruvyl transferase family protein [Clostridiales bacterium]
MKAGILTFHYAHHYGAQLQAYALMRAIQLLGVDCGIINYVRKDNIEGSSLFKKGLSPGAVLSNLDTLLHYRSLKKRHDRFDSFVFNEMKLSEKFYGSYKELCDDPPAYDVYVCGSDQIWNPLIFSEKTYDPAFFADFARSGRRVAYAPSFGISSIPEDKREELAGYLAKFDCLSSREKQGEKIIREITGREAVTVLDPTLLLPAEEWSMLAAAPGSAGYDSPEASGGDSPGTGDGGPLQTGGYILCYFITDARKYADYVGLVAEKYRLPVVSLCGSRRVVPQTKHKRLDCGPREFLGLFREASVVCTDSFHGTVFSLIFEKEFYSFEASKDPSKAVGSRQYNLLETTGLLSRLYNISSGVDGFRKLLDEQAGAAGHMPGATGAQRHADSCRERSYMLQEHVDNHQKHSDNYQALAVNKETGRQRGAIDYQKVRDILRKKREESLSYLKNALVPGGETNAASEENAGVSEIAQTEDQI